MANEATCRTCPWWVATKWRVKDRPGNEWGSDPGDPVGGDCRRMPSVELTRADHWCGEHPARCITVTAGAPVTGAEFERILEVHGSKPSAIREHDEGGHE